MRTVYTFFLFFILIFSAAGQQAMQYSFRHFSVNNGLASSIVYDIVQDKDGYIWMATTNGLQRYDGNSFLTFRAGKVNASGIAEEPIGKLFLDKKGRLWISADNEVVGIFDTKRFVYRAAKVPKDEAKFIMLQHFVELETGELLLIKVGRKVLKYVSEKNQFIPADDLLQHPPNWKITNVLWDKELQSYWIGCDSGVVRYDPATKHVSYRGHNTDMDPGIESFGQATSAYNMGFDQLHNLFLMQWKPNEASPTIFYYNRKINKTDKQNLNDKVLGYHEIFGTSMQRNGRLWIYGMAFMGEWKPDQNKLALMPNEYKNEQSIKFDYVFRVFEDRENNIWIATDNGVFLSNPEAQVFNSFVMVRPGEQPLEPPVQAMAETGEGRIFVGCWGQGLFVFDLNFNPLPIPAAFKNRYRYMSVWDMTTHSRTKKLWITQQGGVLDVYDPHSDQLISFSPSIFQHSTIRQIDEDTSGNLWFGTQSGMVIKWDYIKSGGDPQQGYELIYKGPRILKVHFDYKGFIWVATMGDGIVKIDVHTNKIVRKFSTRSVVGERLFTDSPADMTYYNDSTLLVAASCLNIINTKTNKISFFTVNDGLPSHDLVSIQRDKTGIVWMGMANGFCRMNFEKKIVSYYDRRDGIFFDRFAAAGIEHLSDGRIAFYTDHNFMAFNPLKIAEKNLPPKPYITSFKLAGNVLSLDSLRSLKSISLSYNTSSIVIDFSALSFLQQIKVHYYYKMENLDNDWIHTDHPIQAIYNYLPPGEYVFKVKSENVDGITNQEVATLFITVRQPVWRTWWFYSLIALLFITILYLIDRERIKRRKSLQQVRTQIRSNLRDEVSTTLNNIHVLSEIAKIKADKNVDQAKDFIDQISDKSSYMMEALDDTLWSIDPSNDSMKKFVLRIKELTEGLRSSYQTEIDLIVDHKIQTVEMDMKLRHELFFFYKEAMNFIVQNIPCRQVFVNLNKVRSKLLIEILSECNCDTQAQRVHFKETVQKRVNAMSASMDIIADHRSFSVVLYIEVR